MALLAPLALASCTVPCPDCESGDGGDGEGGGCPAADPDVRASTTIPALEFGNVDVELSCTVTTVDQGMQRLVFDCPDAIDPVPVALEIDFDLQPAPSFPLSVGQALSVRVVVDTPWWSEVRVRIDDAQGQWLLGISDGSGTMISPEFFPFAIEAQPTTCPAQDGGCGLLQRLELELDLGEAGLAYVADARHDGELEWDGRGLDVWVGAASSLSEINCSDTPNSWVRVVAMRR